MAEIDNTVEQEESGFTKYTPLIKSLAAIGVGLASDSAMGRGIATGLANSASSDMERRKIEAELRREQTAAEIERIRKANKAKADMIWDVGAKMFKDDPSGLSKYLRQVGYEQYADIMLPTDIGTAEPSSIQFNAEEILPQVESIQDDSQRTMATAFFYAALHASNSGDMQAYTTNLNRMNQYLNPPEPAQKRMWNDAGDMWVGYDYDEAKKLGYMNSTRPKQDEPVVSDSNQKTLKVAEDSVRSIGNKIMSSFLGDEGYYTKNPASQFMQYAGQIKQLQYARRAAGDDSDIAPFNPFAGALSTTDEILAALPYVEAWVWDQGSADPIADFNAYLVSKRDDIMRAAGSSQADDYGRKIYIGEGPVIPAASGESFTPEDEELIGLYMQGDGLTREQAIAKLKELD